MRQPADPDTQRRRRESVGREQRSEQQDCAEPDLEGVTFIRETPRDVLTNSGAEEIISNVADGVSEAIRGNDDEAESSLGDAVETVQEEIESESIIDRAIELITRLARQLGLDVERVVEPSE